MMVNAVNENRNDEVNEIVEHKKSRYGSGKKPGASHPVASAAKSIVMLLLFLPMAKNASHPFNGW